ncbi:DUF4352 domain-containing protein [Micromonospora sp. CA-269861]|uniref:DUF4352 domain-containing protein n=1 Tax=Micromonospora sp. CA-269861 TaxID=3239968 RepID=UPI003D8EBE81
MTHPQPPVGPQDPQQPNPQPQTRPYAATPQPPFSGSAYAAAGGHTDAGGGYRAPGGPGYPIIAPPPMQTDRSKKSAVVVAVATAVFTLLTCAGGIVAVVIATNRASTTVSEARATPSMPQPVSSDTRGMSPGDTLVVNGQAGTVEITVTKFSSATKPCKSHGLKPGEGMYVIADVTVAVTKGTASTNPLFFQWVAADGTKTTAIGGAFSGCGKPMPADDLTAGTRRTGSVVFDVHDTSGALEYQDQFQTAGSWKP